MDDVVIRPAGEGDLRPVQALLTRMMFESYADVLGEARVAELNVAWHSLAILSTQMAWPGGAFLVAETTSGTLLGHAMANMRTPLALKVFRVFVDPDHQRRGIGVALLDALASRYPKARRMLLEVDSTNDRALAFYASCGFVQIRAVPDGWRTLLKLEKGLAQDRSAPLP
jgi:ribosomal protein S18 acetylase RimI-like enzyme